MPSCLSSIVTRPGRPSVKVKARARGTPAKFEATPENVISGVAEDARQAAADDCVGQQEAEDPADHGGHQADLDAGAVRLDDRGLAQVGVVLERRLAGLGRGSCR